jgi:bacterioferritin
MEGNADIINWLNRQLLHELTAINQYFFMLGCTKTGDLTNWASMNITNRSRI